MKRVPKKLWRVEVTWQDSVFPQGSWHSFESINRDAVFCTSVGFVLADDKKGVVLAGSIHEKQVASVVHIPRGQVRKVRRLR